MPLNISPSTMRSSNIDQSNDVVITGISGTFPECDGIYQLRNNLINKVDMISDDNRRWSTNDPSIPQRSSKIFNVEKFDADFFGIDSEEADYMCPMSRIFLEKSYEAIVDAGLHPKELYGTKTGVFVGVCYSESKTMWYSEKNKHYSSHYSLANRVSKRFKITGPSYSTDSACSSSSFALEQAYKSIRDNVCDAAIVVGTNLCLSSTVTLQFSRLGVLSMDGKCHSFDDEGNGYIRSKSIAAIFLQRKSNSRRIYATVCHAKTNWDDFKAEGVTYLSCEMQKELLKTFYKECRILPEMVSYIETNGTGTKVGDSVEVAAIDDIFCKNRKTPLKIGSVKSNLGHTEPTAGLCSTVKVLILFETGIIPPNLNYKIPRKGTTAIEEGRIHVATECTPFEGSYAAVNSFGFGGANCHILLQKNEQEKINGGVPIDDIPRIVCVSGRTKNSVEVLLEDIESRSVDAEFVGLIQEVFKYDVCGHNYRGYIVLQKTEPRTIIKEIDYFPKVKRPVWFIFSGIGSQWLTMGSKLMEIPVFATAINKCDKVLKPLGIDIKHIITSCDPKIFENGLHSFVGIAAMQIGFFDILTQLRIAPDNLIGCSVGELGCAYAAECITAKQMILSAYMRGLISMENKAFDGVMFEVGLGYQEVKNMSPTEIDVIFNNSAYSCIIAGPSNKAIPFVKTLQDKNIIVNDINIDYFVPHQSHFLLNKGFRLLKELKNIITTPKLRPSRWLSSSVHKSLRSSNIAMFASAEYFVNSFLSSTLFEESCHQIPSDAILIEIASHGLTQPTLKHSLPKTTISLTLASRGQQNINTLLSTVGRLYETGSMPDLINFYPKIQFPVSRGTPMLSPLIK